MLGKSNAIVNLPLDCESLQPLVRVEYLAI